jgi:hypothetical protein
MKKVLISVGLLCLFLNAAAQDQEKYTSFIRVADSLYNAKNYKKSASAYSEAFKALGWKGTPNDRYNAACTAALANLPDTAFFYLNRAIKGGYQNYKHITNDTDLNSLHKDKRWVTILENVKANKEKAEEGLNKPLVAKLDSIRDEDQKYRMQMDGIASKYGWESKQMQNLWKVANKADSINLIKVKSILDQYGWLGPDVVGYEGSTTLFLVIQHSDQQTQEKYLPGMREAVKNKKAQPSSLALLEDRVALGQGKKQIYGSQIGRNPSTNKEYVLPLEDPDNVDKRRAEVGLQPLNEYVQMWNIKWDVEEYKRNLPKDQGIQFLLKNKSANKPITNEDLEVKVVDVSKTSDTARYTSKTNADGLMEKVILSPGKKNVWIKPKNCELIGLMDIVVGENSFVNYTVSVSCNAKQDKSKEKKE